MHRAVAGEQTYTLTVTDGSGASAVARVSVILWDFPASLYFSSDHGSINAASPHKITWTATRSDDTPIARFDLFVSTDGTTFHPIAECSGLPGAARECFWQQPGPEGNVILRIVARSASGQIAGAHMLGIVYGTPPSPPPSPWQGQDIGASASLAMPGILPERSQYPARVRTSGAPRTRSTTSISRCPTMAIWSFELRQSRVTCLDESGRDDSRIADARLAARVDVREPWQRASRTNGASRPAERAFTRLRQWRPRRTG